MKLTRHHSALLPTIAARVPCGIHTSWCGKLEHGAKGEEAETLGLRHIMLTLDMSLFHEELKVLRHLGGQQLSHQQLHFRSGWEEQTYSISLGITFHGKC